tara:strand:- start:11155 stop:11967 length:813 start_codon:yes stop_codon:yes gene_type:complete
MSIVVDETPSNVVEQVTETQEVTEAVQVEETQVEEALIESTYEAPEKYAGKTLEEVIGMHQNVEKALGTQGQTVGEQRKLIDQLMEQSQASQAIEPSDTLDSFEDNFYDDPAKAVNSAIENHPEIIKAREGNIKSFKNGNLVQLETTHPDFMDVVGDSGFQKWVGESGIRTELFRRADNNYDYDSANELIGTWKQISMIDKTNEVNKAEASKRKKAMRQTSSETRSSGDSVGGKKIYRRSDLINLQISDPSRYSDLSDEITMAYQEGRVK